MHNMSNIFTGTINQITRLLITDEYFNNQLYSDSENANEINFTYIITLSGSDILKYQNIYSELLSKDYLTPF